MTASQLERAVGAYRWVTAAEANDLQALAYVGYSWEQDGSLVLRARLAPEDGALVLRALEAARDRLQERNGKTKAVPRNRLARRTPRPSLPWRTCRWRTAEATDRVVSGTRSSFMSTRRTARASWKTVPRSPRDGAKACLRRLGRQLVERDGEPLSVGRKTRTIHLRSAAPSRRGTDAAAFPGATTAASSTPITSGTGRAAVRPRWATSSSSAGATTASCTRPVTRSCAGRRRARVPGSVGRVHRRCRRVASGRSATARRADTTPRDRRRDLRERRRDRMDPRCSQLTP